jgi:hypothetical protein
MRKPLPAIAFLVLASVLYVKPLVAQGVCPISDQLNPQSASNTLNVPKYESYRPLVAADYVVIEYNASQKKPAPQASDPNAGLMSWTDYKRSFDYRGLNNTTHLIGPNGSFLPVIYTKEKIAVRVCGLHFTDVLTVTTSPNGVPEGGADIRGAAAITPPASLSSTLDMLQSGSATGGTTTLPGLGLNAPAGVPSLSLSGITLGNLGAEDQTPGKYPSYTPATVTVSGRQVALLLYSVMANAKELTRLIGRTQGEAYPSKLSQTNAPVRVESPVGFKALVAFAPHTEARMLAGPEEGETNETAQAHEGEEKYVGNAPGSVKGVEYILKRVYGNVKSDADEADPNSKSNSAAFDRDMTDIQNVNAQISTLASALSSQAFASNAITLLNNYSTLIGVLDLASLVRSPYCQGILPTLQPGKLSADDVKKIDLTNLGNLTLSQVQGLDPGQIQDKTFKAKVQSIQVALKVLKYTNPANDEPLCSAFEKQKITDFWNSYNQEVVAIVHEISTDTADPDEKTREQKKNDRKENLNCTVGEGAHLALVDPYTPDPDPKAIDKFGMFAGCRLTELSEKLNSLRVDLREIDSETTELYDKMNEWYFRSSVEQTDLLAPLTSNAFVRISIVVQRGYTPFTLANAGGTITPTVTANTIPTSTTASTSTPAHAVKTVLVEVHRLANFNLMGGVMVIHIPTGSYAVQASPTAAVVSTTSTTGYGGTCNGQPVQVPAPTAAPMPGQSVNYGCVLETQKTQWQLAGMAGIVWYPWGHDYFPRRSGFANSGRNLLPSLLVATSVTSLGNAMGGVNWEPASGLNFYAGVSSGHKTSLPGGLLVNTAVASGTTLNTVTTEHVGFTVGVGFDLNTIMTLFSSKTTSVATMP